MLSEAGLLPQDPRKRPADHPGPPRPGRWPAVTVPLWAWAAFLAFVVAMLALDVFVLHRKAHEVSLREAAAWSAVWIVLGLGFGGLVWAWAGAGNRPGLPGGLPDREEPVGRQHLPVRRHLLRVRDPGALPAPGAHVRHHRRAAHAGRVHRRRHRACSRPSTRSSTSSAPSCSWPRPTCCAATAMPRRGNRACCASLRRVLPVTDPAARPAVRECRDGGRLLATPLLVALVVVETTDVIFAVDSIPAILAVTTDPFIVYTSNVFALLGMRALYFLLAGAQAGSATCGPAWPSSSRRRGQAAARRRMGVSRLVSARVHHRRAVRRRRRLRPRQPETGQETGQGQGRGQVSGRHAAAASAPRDQAPAPAPEDSNRADAQRRASAAAPRAARR